MLVHETGKTVEISLQGDKKAHILNIHVSSEPSKVILDEVILSDSLDYHFDEKRNKLIIKTNEYSTGNYRIVK